MTHYPVLAQLEQLYPGTVGNFHMSYVEAETTGVLYIMCVLTHQQPCIHNRFYYTVSCTAGEGYEKIVFLYQLEGGQAGKSYGLNVAALAGLDPAILRVAAEKSRELEAQCCRRSKLASQKKGAAKTIISLVKQQQGVSFDPGTVIDIAKQVAST